MSVLTCGCGGVHGHGYACGDDHAGAYDGGNADACGGKLYTKDPFNASGMR
jgi:hypothetical protein